MTKKKKDIVSYTKRGIKKWKYDVYMGINPYTLKPERLKKANFDTKKEAEAHLIKAMAERKSKMDTSATKDFKHVWQEFLDYKEKRVKKSTWLTYMRYSQIHILPHFGKLKLKDITTTYCRRVVDKWEIQVNGIAIKLRRLTAQILDFAVRMEYITTNVMRNTYNPVRDTSKSNAAVFLTKQELLNFLSDIKTLDNPVYYTYFHLLAFTGMRKGEALGLEWDDIDWEEKTIFVRKTLGLDEHYIPYLDTPKTKSSYEKVGLDDETINVLKKWYEIRKQQLNPSFLFVMKDGRLYRPQAVNDWLKWIHKQFPNHPKLKPHDFRHTHCCLCFEAGMSVAEVQHRLRHSDFKTTMNIYNHLYPENIAVAADKFSSFMME
ncbi:tyrosine-type recombinase/integrase [Brochothrix campestris]|uniref:tyrosine-type recombinase/integrase n=1 Tax=Brochothrix campestris TaxID=2757 RepID=UPI0038D1871E